MSSRAQREAYFESGEGATEYRDCPGCDKCEANDGYVLRRGSWRPTKAHEYVFLLAKSDWYFCDAEAVREKAVMKPQRRLKQRDSDRDKAMRSDKVYEYRLRSKPEQEQQGRNPRTVWTINPGSYPGSHYAVFPEALPEFCIKAGTSEYGVCPICGSSWARVVEREPARSKDCPKTHASYNARGGEGQKKTGTVGRSGGGRVEGHSRTVSWRPTCNHDAEAVPATVLDMFCGSGTVGIVARKLGRHAILLDLSYPYLHDNARERLGLDKMKEWETGATVEEDADLSELPLFQSLEDAE